MQRKMTEMTGEGGIMLGSTGQCLEEQSQREGSCSWWWTVLTAFSEGRNKMISPGKKQFDLAERRLLETLERVALCSSWDGSQIGEG